MKGNALYLDLVAKELSELGAATPEQIIQRVADNPDNLFSLAIERLKRDKSQWRNLLKPLLGALLVARQPLGLRALRKLIRAEDDELRDGLQHIGGLVARDGIGRYYLFHLKLQEFLRQDEQRPERYYIFAVDEERYWHQKLADWCTEARRGLAGIWDDALGDVGEQERRTYARQHYITHLAVCRREAPACSDKLCYTGSYA